jgi:aminoacrylate hydrolase
VLEKSVPHTTVFLHGYLNSHKWFLPTIDSFHHKKGSAILLDWRGSGKSSPPKADHDMNLEVLGKDVHTLLDKLEIEECHLVGHGTGGLIALEAAQYNPDRFLKILLLDSWGPSGWKLDKNIEELVTKMSKDEDLAGRFVGGTIKNFDFESKIYNTTIKPDAFAGARNIGLRLFKSLYDYNAELRFKTIKNEVLIVHGKDDATVPLKEAELLSRILPNSRLRILDDQGHCANIENPKKFADLIETYLA